MNLITWLSSLQDKYRDNQEEFLSKEELDLVSPRYVIGIEIMFILLLLIIPNLAYYSLASPFVSDPFSITGIQEFFSVDQVTTVIYAIFLLSALFAIIHLFTSVRRIRVFNNTIEIYKGVSNAIHPSKSISEYEINAIRLKYRDRGKYAKLKLFISLKNGKRSIIKLHTDQFSKSDLMLTKEWLKIHKSELLTAEE